VRTADRVWGARRALWEPKPILGTDTPPALVTASLDIGGSLIKLVYFSPNVDNTAGGSVAGAAVAGGRLHFLKVCTG